MGPTLRPEHIFRSRSAADQRLYWPKVNRQMWRKASRISGPEALHFLAAPSECEYSENHCPVSEKRVFEPAQSDPQRSHDVESLIEFYLEIRTSSILTLRLPSGRVAHLRNT